MLIIDALNVLNVQTANIITILGPTATGKTKLAAQLAYQLDGEIISADSRQVYRDMNIGTGKDYEDYLVNGKNIPYHLIDIIDAGTEYNVYQYQKDFLKAYNHFIESKKTPILCGGTGMYIEAVLKGYKLVTVPENNEIRRNLEKKSEEELKQILSSLQKRQRPINYKDRNRTIRAIEIATYHKEHPEINKSFHRIKSAIFGIYYDREIIRQKITKRLKKRLKNGMIEEVQGLLDKDISPEKLIAYGLEYKFVTQYLLGEWAVDEMFQKLNTAIHQFAKRQMTWFRRMERNGFNIHWLNGELPIDKKIEKISKTLQL